MTFREFEQLAHTSWDQIPEEYKSGVDGVRVLRRAKPHDELADVYTLGECLTEGYHSDVSGPETTRSTVFLYYGSFAALAELDDEFDWEEEVWETLTHELQHHLESLAMESALEDVDYAADENFKRHEGKSFDPLSFRSGHPMTGPAAPWLHAGSGEPVMVEAYYVEGDWFFELPRSAEVRAPRRVTLEWMGAFHAFDLPVPRADITYGILGGGFAPVPVPSRRIEEVAVVIVRSVSWVQAVLTLFAPQTPTVEEVDVDVTTVANPT